MSPVHLSRDWDQRAHQTIPGGTSTLAKSTSRLHPEVSPFYATHASAQNFWDVDGNRWVDFEMAMGTVIWGHAHPAITEAVCRQVTRGTSYSTPHINEPILAELLVRRFENYDSLRFLKSGADAINACIRIARAHTGRNVVLTTEYHGWGPESLQGFYPDAGGVLGLAVDTAAGSRFATAGDAIGVRAAIEASAGSLAAVVVCPNRWTSTELQQIQQSASRAGALLIFDEVTCGMRAGRQAMAGRRGVWPDLLCVSKGMANGLPLSVILGRRDLVARTMPAKITTAHATEAVAMAAAIASEELLATEQAWPRWEPAVDALLSSLRQSAAEAANGVRIIGDHTSFALTTENHADFWTDPVRLRVVHACAQVGIFSKGYIVPCAAHTQDDFDRLQEALTSALTPALP